MTIAAATREQGLLETVVQHMERDPRIDMSLIDVETTGDCVTLTGTVAWRYQKAAVERAIGAIPGVRKVESRVTVQHCVSRREVEYRIAVALQHTAELNAAHIIVQTAGRAVRLSGDVVTWVAKHEAERAAWRAPGVADVRNEIEIRP